jgi:capsid protein
MRAVAAGTRGSYSSIARDYNGTYSSQRQELVESFEGYNVLQQWFVGQHSRPVYRAWLAMALLTALKSRRMWIQILSITRFISAR